MVSISRNKDVRLTNPNVVNDWIDLNGVDVISVEQSIDIPTYPVTSEGQISNQISFQTKSFRINGQIFDAYTHSAKIINFNRNQLYTILMRYRGIILSMDTSFGYFPKVMISNINVSNVRQSNNSYPFSLTVQEIIIVEPILVSYQILVDKDGNIISGVPSGGSLEEQDLTKITKKDGVSIWTKIGNKIKGAGTWIKDKGDPNKWWS